MSIFNNKKMLPLLARIMLPIFLVILFITFISILYSYEYIRQQTWDMKYSDTIVKLLRMQGTTTEQINNMLQAAHIFRSAGDVEAFALYPDIPDATLTKITQEISNYMKSFSGIDSVYLLNQKAERMLVFNSSTTYRFCDIEKYYDKEIIKLLTSTDLKRNRVYPRSVVNSSGKGIHYFTVVGFDGYAGKNGPLSAAVLNFNEESLSKVVNEETRNISSPVVINAKGVTLSNNGYFELFDDISDYSFIQDILSQNDSGYLECVMNGERYYALYTGSDEFGNRIMQLTPVAGFSKPFEQAKNNLILLVLLMFFIAVTLFCVTAYITSLPVTAMVKTLHSNEIVLWRNSKKMKDRFLQDLLWFTDRYSHETLGYELKRLEISFEADTPITLIHFYIDDFNETKNDKKNKDTEALVFGVANVVYEIASQNYPCEIVSYPQNGTLFVFLCPTSTDATMVDTYLNNLLKTISKILFETLGISVTMFYSASVTTPLRIDELRDKILLAARYRPFLRESKILNVDSIPQKANQNSYEDLLKKLNQFEASMIDNDVDRSLAIINEIFEIHNTPDELIFLWSILLNAYFEKILIRYPPEISEPAFKRIAQAPALGDFSSAGEILDWLSSFTAYVCGELKCLKGSSQYDLINRTNEMIETFYVNPDLNVSYIAEKLGISATHLSRTYKKRTSASIIDRITEYRIRDACKLLIESDLSTQAISEKCGYLNSAYFSQIFKNETGVTPTAYRNMNNIRANSSKSLF